MTIYTASLAACVVLATIGELLGSPTTHAYIAGAIALGEK